MLLNDESYRFIERNSIPQEMSHSFLNVKYENIDLWKQEARAHIQQNLFYSPTPVALNERMVERVEFERYVREKVYFDSALGSTIPAYLLIPNNLKAPAPAIVALHDHGAMFYWGKEKAVEQPDGHPILKKYIDHYYAGTPLAVDLANRGYVVLVIDSLFFGERRWKLEAESSPFKQRLEQYPFESAEYIGEYNQIEQEIESQLVRSIFYKGHTFLGIRMWDDMASVNYLCSRPEVDSNRIGCIGLSMGGHRSGWLSAMDDRIKCSVIIGWMARHEEMIRHRIDNIAWMWAAPGIYQSLDYPDIVSLAAPKPLLIQHGSQDFLFPEETGQKAIEVIRQVYRKASSELSFSAEIYDVPHEFNRKMKDNAYSWIDRHLKTSV